MDPGERDTHSRTIAAEAPGRSIGRYTLVEQIGEGGFGSVWSAEQREPVRRRVALKIIKLGMDTKQVIARFEVERQALALMEHPNIAKVFDAGATQGGRPYFVMELVPGVSILEHCDAEKLDVRQRLQLFIAVCHAIQHAHQKGIVHRDIKPSNVLVTLHDGVPAPKVIDFGIAKATQGNLANRTLVTEQHQIIGTPAYMSPEQIGTDGLDVDTRSDIYSLGVLLYELLTGATPFDIEDLHARGVLEMVRVLRDEEPSVPSARVSKIDEATAKTAERRRVDVARMSSLLRGDLDWIVMKCLEKDRTRRYESASDLSADIQRHLSDEPVLAGPPSRSYRLRKFVKRNRAAVMAGAVIAVVLVLGIVGTSIGMVWALEERTRARQAADAEASARSEAQSHAERATAEAERAEGEAQRALAAEAQSKQRAEELDRVADFQASQLSAIDPRRMGVLIREDLLAALGEGLERARATPETIASEQRKLSELLQVTNMTSVALRTLDSNIFKRTLSAVDEEFGEQPLVRAHLLETLAKTMVDLGLVEPSIEPRRHALEIRRKELGSAHRSTLNSMVNLGGALRNLGRTNEAEPLLREALESARQTFGDDDVLTITVINHMSNLLDQQGKSSEAAAYFREAVEHSRRVLGAEHKATITAINNLGVVLQNQGALAEAEPYLREALELGQRKFGDTSPFVLTAMNNLGALLRDQGKESEAEAFLRDGLALSRQQYGDDHPDTLSSIGNLALLLAARGEHEESDALLREAIERARRTLGDDNPATLLVLNNRGMLLLRRGRASEAEPLLREVLETSRRVLGDDHPQTVMSIDNFRQVTESLAR